MFEKIDKKKVAGVVLAGILTVTGATTAFAADQTGSSQQAFSNNRPIKMDFSKMSETIKSAIESLVSAGTINQTQADAVTKEFAHGRGKGAPFEAGKNRMNELVTAGTITQVQADAISSATKSARENKKNIEDILKEMVTSGTITQEQADAVAKVCTPGNRKGNPPEGRKSPADELVTAGTITQAQADAISNALKNGRESKKSSEEVLKELVTAGTLTQEQADTIVKEFDHGKSRGRFQSVRKNPLDELVTAGTINQTQADAINSAVKSALDSLNK
jgi:polyhydroxyalkanoate synthesis regulator phasin